MTQYRKTPRANWILYNEGSYFVTVCCKGHRHYFGEIYHGDMHHSAIGEFLDNELKNASLHHPHISVSQHVVMPNHFHAIVHVDTPAKQYNVPMSSEERCLEGYLQATLRAPAIGCNRPLLSSYVGSLKSAVTKFAHSINKEFAWQPRFHDHMLRGSCDANNISNYILNNITKWESDCFNK